MLLGQPKASIVLWLAGPMIWAMHFFLLYGAHTLICSAAGARPDWLMLPIAIGLTAVACVTLGFIALHGGSVLQERDQEGARFLRDTGRLLAGLGLLAVLWTAWPTGVVSSCTPT